MKTAITYLALALCNLLSVHAQTDSSTEETSSKYSYSGETGRTAKFATEAEAVEAYRAKLSKADTFAALYAAFGITGDNKTFEDQLPELDAKWKRFSSVAGALVKVDVCLTPKLGDSLQRAGYVFLFQHSVAFADVWFVHTEEGWHMGHFALSYDSDFSKTLETIPAAYFCK